MISIQADDIQEIKCRREYVIGMATALDKRHAMAPAFKITEREKEIDDLLASLKLAMAANDEKKAAFDAAADAVKLSERTLIADAEGSNDAKRGAAAEQLMVTDKDHLKLVKAELAAQAKAEEASRDLVMLGRRLGAKNRALDAQIAILHFLAGGE